MRPGDTPVPISNTTVKTRSADGTIPETVWESRWMPLCFVFLVRMNEVNSRLEDKYTSLCYAK